MTIELKKMPPRAVIYCKDIQNILGRTESGAARIMRIMRKRFKKVREQYITVTEFSEYSGIAEEIIYRFLLHTYNISLLFVLSKSFVLWITARR